MSQRAFTARPPRGFTLIELLVVILIMLMLTGLAIPVIAPALANRQQREGSRAVNAYIGGARERAVSLGRPVGIKLERFEGQRDICNTLSYVEVPPPYTGDIVNARLACLIQSVIPVGNGSNGGINGVYDPDMAQVIVQADELAGFTGGFDVNQLLLGDTIQFDFQGGSFRIIGPAAANGRITNLPLQLETFVLVSSMEPRQTPGGQPYWGTTALPFPDLAMITTLQPSQVPNLPYRVHRLPVRSGGDPLELPTGTVIDLNFSGYDGAPFHPRGGDPAYPTDPHTGFPLRPLDASPIYIMFSPSGGLDRIYTRLTNGGWDNFRPTGPIYLLVGKRELVRPDLYTLDPDLIDPNAIHFNWQDLSAIWVTVSPSTGLVTSVENSVTLGWPPANNETTPMIVRLNQSRLLAREGRGMGGR